MRMVQSAISPQVRLVTAAVIALARSDAISTAALATSAILGTLGLSGLIHPVQVPRGIIASDNLWMLGLTLLLFPVIFTARRIARWEGILLLASYGLYLAVLLGRAGDA